MTRVLPLALRLTLTLPRFTQSLSPQEQKAFVTATRARYDRLLDAGLADF